MKFRMMSTICLSGLLLLSLVTGASAANKMGSKAEIPFAFYVGSVHFNPGEIAADQSGVNDVMIRLSQLKDNNSAYILGNRSASPNYFSGKPRFVFHKYGENYFLREVWLRSGEPGYVFPVTPQEKELMNASATPNTQQQTVEVAAR
jgi:hypothetical protein